ncbi:ATP-grasp domain-containing protein [Planktothricoides raciborskii]|uniref:ATP-grasp domain-containing protein n=2 Tax=Planktothricoides raciborskii TaxID=132608 RepID=A0AAU8JIN7_9CYAN|nr:ATP-grasp domain-containing protein [Planktothricoides raciborskii]MBD2546046.1 ATP-grasp domain-containing protein [Planktothricoides raciborskii FACHB-1370]MBD2584304.1 ATP-grasp domain-containing protein [Planktothricoides raciborskii FACHB-1261]
MKLIQTTKTPQKIIDKEILVWAFIPCLSLDQDFSNQEFNPLYFQQELGEVFAELDIAWKLKLVTLENMNEVISEVAASQAQFFPVVLNYCAGLDEIDGYPGASVVKLLEAKGIPFTGADSHFFKMGDSKILMKQAFVEAGVSTAPYEVIKDMNSIRGLCDRLIPPLIVKPSSSFGARGISLQSVVHTDEEAIARFEALQQGQHGMEIPANSIFVERFIKGREFTVLVTGTAQHPEGIKIYPALETVFHSGVPETERFYTRDLWTVEAEERTPLPVDESLYRYQLAPIELQDRLCDLAKRAYFAVGGTGYGRVDIRIDDTTEEMFVLEVNPCPFVTSMSLAMAFENPNASKVGTILHLAKVPFSHLMSEIIGEALTEDLSIALNLINNRKIQNG